MGITCGGSYGSVFLNTTEVLDYSDESITAGTSMSVQLYKRAAAGNAEFGIVAGGGNLTSVTKTVNKYMYGTNVTANLVTLDTGTRNLTGASNSAIALFAGGYAGGTVATVEKYSLVDETKTSAESLLLKREGGAAASTPEFALFIAGYTTVHDNSTEKYFFSTEARSAGASLQQVQYPLAGTGNSYKAVTSGGHSESTTVIQEYLYANDVTNVSPATLIVGRGDHSALCTTPGGF